MKIARYIIGFLLIITISNCKKKDSTTPDSAGNINITKPTTLTIGVNGSALIVEGDMTDLNAIAIAKVEIKNRTSGAVLYSQSTSAGNPTFYRFSWSWAITGITTTTPATVKVTCVDKQSNEVSREVNFTLDN